MPMSHVLCLNMPPLGSTRGGLASGEGAYLDELCEACNTDWLEAIGSLDSQGPGINMVGVNADDLTESFLSDPSKCGFSNGGTPAQGQNVSPNDHLFWDGVRPTTVGRHWVANLAYRDLTATPEPPIVVLFGRALLAGRLASDFSVVPSPRRDRARLVVPVHPSVRPWVGGVDML